MADMNRPLKLFFSYSHQDEALREELEDHLSLLKEDGFIRTWHDRSIEAGKEWEREIDHHLGTADIVLLLVSPSFIASRYCWSIEMKEALERHRRGETRVIPIILRPVDWKSSPIGGLQALPKDARPVVEWPLKDRAFLEVVIELRRVISSLTTAQPEGSVRRQEPMAAARSRDLINRDVSDRCIKEFSLSLPGGEHTQVLAWSPKERWIALGSSVQTVVVDLRNDGRSIWKSPRDTYQLRWSPDGSRLAVVDSETCAVLEGSTGKELWAIPNEGGVGSSFSWSPDGRRLAVSNYREASIVDAETGRALCRIDNYPKGILWSPMGTHLAIGQLSDPLQLWCVTGPDAPSLLDLSIQEAQPCAWSPNGSKLALFSNEIDIIHVWKVYDDGPDLKLALKTPVPNQISHSGVAWSPSGAWIAATTMPGVQIFDAADGHELLLLPAAHIATEDMDISPSGLQIATIEGKSDLCSLRIWDLSDLPA